MNRRSRLFRQLRDQPLSLFNAFESLDYAQEVHDARIEVLKNGGKNAQKLAKKLEKCAKDRAKGKPACGSAACPECQHHFRKSLIEEATRLFANYILNEDPNAMPFRMTAVIDRWTIEQGQLIRSVAKVEAESRKLSGYLRKHGMAQGILLASVDVSWNTDHRDGIDPHWQIHLEIVFIGIDPEHLRKLLKRRYRKTETIFRPMWITEVKDPADLPGIVGYGSKLQHNARSRYLKEKKNRTSKFALKNRQQRTLSRFYDRLGPFRQIILIGARRHGLTLRRVVPKTTDKRGAK